MNHLKSHQQWSICHQKPSAGVSSVEWLKWRWGSSINSIHEYSSVKTLHWRVFKKSFRMEKVFLTNCQAIQSELGWFLSGGLSNSESPLTCLKNCRIKDQPFRMRFFGLGRQKSRASTRCRAYWALRFGNHSVDEIANGVTGSPRKPSAICLLGYIDWEIVLCLNPSDGIRSIECNRK